MNAEIVRAENVPESLKFDVMQYLMGVRDHIQINPVSLEQQIATILTMAIQAGVVSEKLPKPVEVREYWRVKSAKGVSGIFIGLPADFDTKSAAVLRAMTYNAGTVEIEHVRETVLSREEVKP